MLLVDSWTYQSLSAEEESSRAPMVTSHTRLVRPSSKCRNISGVPAAAISVLLKMFPSCAAWQSSSRAPLHSQSALSAQLLECTQAGRDVVQGRRCMWMSKAGIYF